jgi:glycosyltransferase involved in cell wall biosynthesis
VVVVAPSDGPYRHALQRAGVTVIIDPLVLVGVQDSMHILRHFDLVVGNTILTAKVGALLQPYTQFVCYVHETGLVSQLASSDPGTAQALRVVEHFWAGSERAANALKDFGVRARILEYGTELPPPTERRAPLKVALFGSFEPRKGQDIAIRALLLLPPAVAEDIQLTLCGRVLDRPFRTSVDDLAAELKNVVFRPGVTIEQYAVELAAADVVLVCSRDDTLPFVSLDALAAGKVLVCSRTTGTSKYVTHGVSAFVLEKNDPEELAAQLAELQADRSVLLRVGQEAARLHRSMFSAEMFSSRLQRALASLPS